jgi:hypothetical protein
MVYFGGKPSAGCQNCRSKKIRVSPKSRYLLAADMVFEVRPAAWRMWLLQEEGTDLSWLSERA